MNDSPIDAPGWHALDQRFCAIYPGALPHQFTSPSPYDLDSPYPLPAITVWEAPGSRGGPDHWLYLSYGLSELFEKTTQDGKHSGLGFEITFALERSTEQDRPPSWPLSLMQGIGGNLLRGDLEIDTGSILALGRSLQGGPEQANRPSGCVCVPDELAGEMQGPFGRVLFLRLLGLCQEELEQCEKMELAPQIDMLAELCPHAVTDPDRAPWSEDEQRAKILRRHRLGIRW